MSRRIAFGLLFILGTLAAAIGWLGGWFGLGQVASLAIIGHVAQILGVIGVMSVPDKVEHEKERVDEEF